MKQRRVWAFLAGSVILFSLFGFIKFEDDPIKKILAQLDKWTSDYPQEKVYLHLDKPYYAAGDNIWFKAYVTVGPSHQLSALSGILNVELINDQDSVKQSIKLPLTNGTCWGDFALPDTLRAGNYRIRAYTNWMRNFSAAYFYDQPLIIGNVLASNVLVKASYTYTPQQTSATIHYTDVDQTPYAGKDVSYEVRLDNRQVARGKGVTDPQGNLIVNFSSAEVPGYHMGRLVTRIKADKGNVTKIISFRSASAQTDVQFFPEGGNLVNGISSTVAFKAVGANGLGADVRGDILDNDNHKVASFTTRHLGMGSFMLNPENGRSYKAAITYPDGTRNTVNLPQAQNSGYVLSVNNAGDNLRVRITTTADLVGHGQNSEISLVAQESGVVCYAAKNKLENTSFTALVPKSKFPAGVVQFTLFSASGDPVAERLVFVRNDNDLLKLDITSDKTAYAPRENTKLSLHARDNTGKPVVGAFSAAVINETTVPVNENDESSILSDILLTSDLQGYIEQPGYYFANVSDRTQADLDVLMLTQGYRRFEWKSLMAGVFPIIKYQPEKSLQITGTLKTSNGKPVPNGRVTLFTTTGGAFVLDTVSNAQGRFAFHNLLFKDSIRFVIQARTVKNSKNVEIELDRPVQQTVSGGRTTADLMMTAAPGFNSYLKNSKQQYENDVKYGLNGRTIVLKEVVIRDKRPELKNSSNLNGAGNADQVIKGDIFETQGCPTMADCLQGRLLGVVFRNGVPYSTRSFNRPMQIIVDGAYVDPDYANTINPLDIGSIEVLRSGMYTSIYGGQGGNGVFIINTKRGGDYTPSAYARYAPGIVTYTPKGFYVARQFYKPVYAGPQGAGTGADLRTTIDWERSLITDKDGNTSFSFFNADSKGTYRVVIEGIDSEGHLGRQVYRYQVQ